MLLHCTNGGQQLELKQSAAFEVDFRFTIIC